MNDEALELALIRSVVSDVPERDPEAMHRATQRLARLIETERAAPSIERRHLRGRDLVGIAACLALVAFVVQVLLPYGRGGPSHASAFEELAASASSATATLLPPDGFAYQRSVVQQLVGGEPTEGEDWSATLAREVETWIAVDGSGRTVASQASVTFPTVGDEAAWRQAGAEPLSGVQPSDERFASGELTYFELTRVANTPEALRKAIEGDAELGMPRRPLDLLDAVADLLRRPYAPPDYRATLFRVVAGIEGVDATSDDTGILVSVESDGQRLELLFDADTSELLVERTLTLLPDGSEQVFQEIRYLESGVVGSVDERP